MAIAQLYYEEVSVGDSVKPMYQFIDQMQLIKWAVASGNRGPGHYDIFHTTSGNGNYPSITGQLKTALLEKMIRDWAGPRAWIKKMSVQYRQWDRFFDLKSFAGEVTGKREEKGRNLVEVSVQMSNSDGDRTTKGTITVALPSRSS
jgi:hypothetical protein